MADFMVRFLFCNITISGIIGLLLLAGRFLSAVCSGGFATGCG